MPASYWRRKKTANRREFAHSPCLLPWTHRLSAYSEELVDAITTTSLPPSRKYDYNYLLKSRRLPFISQDTWNALSYRAGFSAASLMQPNYSFSLVPLWNTNSITVPFLVLLWNATKPCLLFNSFTKNVFALTFLLRRSKSSCCPSTLGSSHKHFCLLELRSPWLLFNNNSPVNIASCYLNCAMNSTLWSPDINCLTTPDLSLSAFGTLRCSVLCPYLMNIDVQWISKKIIFDIIIFSKIKVIR